MMGLGDVMSAMWGECEMQNGMHFNAQRYVAIELIDPETCEVLPMNEGAVGEVVYTTFEREATPLLRYRSRDHMQLIGNGCACGRTSPKFQCIGRTDDMIIYKGMNIFPTAIREFVMKQFGGQVEPQLRIWKDHAHQVKFDTPIPLEIEASSKIVSSSYPELANDISNKIRQHMQVRTDVKILPPASFPRSSYKTPLVYVREPGSKK
jgi:benzoylacetate-CoA ligase